LVRFYGSGYWSGPVFKAAGARADGPMRKLVLLTILALLAGCGRSENSPATDSGKDGVAGWILTSGKRPSRAEYAALVASCRQGAVRSARGKPFEPGKPLEACLADLGLRRE
jgi:hypothetical protein